MISIFKRILIRFSGLFDPQWYLESYTDVAASGMDPLLHYARYGAAEGRKPNATFDVRRYRRLFADVPAEKVLVDYLVRRCFNRRVRYFASNRYDSFDLRESIENSSHWNSHAYLTQNPDVLAAGCDPLDHFINFGIREGRQFGGIVMPISDIKEVLATDGTSNPLDLVDAEWYFGEYPALRNSGLSAQDHYEIYGKFEGRHPRFDPYWYLEQYADVATSGLAPRLHYDSIGRAQARHPAFHPDWYLRQNPDVADAGMDPFEHYILLGRREGRHPAFNWVWYLDEYRDVADAGIDPYEHFAKNGNGEGRHPAFHREWYATEYGDVAQSGLDPYEHYRKFGAAQARRPADGPHVYTTYRERIAFSHRPYESVYEPRQNFDGYFTDIKALAFYLPQFHRCDDNDLWWGEGFTEWSNTRNAKPRFGHHYQPREPHDDIGYYDLADANTLRHQAEIAKAHGIYGFCFYHYWFSGRRVLEKPLDLLISHPDIDLPFCICWANENWTRTWDGLDSEILLKQEYSIEDQQKFIVDLEKYLLDPRYIRINGRPVVLVYKPQIIPNVGDTFSTWRLYWRRKYGTELDILCVQTDPEDRTFSALGDQIDGIVEFPPHVVPASPHAMPYMIRNKKQFGDLSGHYFDYRRLVEDVLSGNERSCSPKLPFYRGVMLGWDNSARREMGWTVWYGYSSTLYYRWLHHVVDEARASLPLERRFVFINAWNEWAEGTYLEPDKRSGYRSLNVTSRALFGLPDEPDVRVIGDALPPSKVGRVGVHLHVYFDELLDELIGYIANIPFAFDLFVTTDDERKRDRIAECVRGLVNAETIEILVVENRGRDIGPMLNLGRRLLEYDYIGHFHSKMSTTVDWGSLWRRFLLDHLLGSPEGIAGLFRSFAEDPHLGILFPPMFPLLPSDGGWASMREECEALMRRLGCDVFMPDTPVFPAGNMFWARRDAISPVLEQTWSRSDFDDEAGQLEKTLGHLVERIWGYVAASRGFDHRQVLLERRRRPPAPPAASRRPTRLAIFVHYDTMNRVGAADMHLIRSLASVTSRLVVVSNSNLDEDDVRRVRLYSGEVLIRPNEGLDFAAWRDAIRHLGWEYLWSFDELLLINNSCFGPVSSFHDMFAAMEADPADFWGISSFPESPCSDRPEAAALPGRDIPFHLQSYFMLFRRRVVKSSAFYNFWRGVENKESLVDVVASYEVQMTRKLLQAGFTTATWVPGLEYLQIAGAADPRYNAPYNDPYRAWLLGSPLVKKRAWQYAPAEMLRLQKALGESDCYPKHLLAP